MLTVKLWQYAKKFNSTAQPSDENAWIVSGVFRDKASMLNPVIEIRSGLNSSDAPINWNFAYIPTFDRYYFISDWVFDGGLWVAIMTCDELATWKERIGHAWLYALRSSVESLHDGSIIDNAWISTVNNTSIVHSAIKFWPTLGANLGTYIVGTVAGTDSADGFVTYYVINSANNLAQLGREVFAGANWGNLGDITEDAMKAIANPAQFIVSCKWFPFATLDEDTYVGYSNVCVGFQKLDLPASRVRTAHPQVTTLSVTIPKHPQSDYGQYMNAEPYTRYGLILQPWGEVSIDPSLFINDTSITLKAMTDLVSGDSVLTATGDTSGAVQYLGNAKVGVDIAIAAASGTVEGNVLATAARSIGAAIPIVSDALNGLGAAIETGGSKNNTTGSNGSMLVSTADAYFTAQFFYQVERDVSDRGLPCCKNVIIAEKGTGYYKVYDGEIEAPASDSELQKIKSMLEAGFFYE